jgi:hypothetical protein
MPLHDRELETLCKATADVVRLFVEQQCAPLREHIGTLERKLETADQIVATLGDALRELEAERARLGQAILEAEARNR